MLPNLEPLLGAALGLNLAYLNLAVFAYITRISDSVSHALEALEASATATVRNTAWYKQLKAIADVKTVDRNRNFLPDSPWIYLPPTVWGFLFNVLFYWRVAKIVSIIGTVYVGAMLAIGTAHNSGLMAWLFCRDADSIAIHFAITLGAFLWPMLMAAAGAWVRWQSIRFLRYQVTSLGQQALSDATATVEQTTQAIASADQSQGRS